MPYRIIRACIFRRVKPYQLFYALMLRRGLNPTSLATAMSKRGMQSQIHRFVFGEVRNPARSTAAPLAKFFGVPIDAVYEESVATASAKELGLSIVPMPTAQPKKKPSAKMPDLSEDALREARLYDKMSEAEQETFRLLRRAALDAGKKSKDVNGTPRTRSQGKPRLGPPRDSGMGDLGRRKESDEP